MTRKSCTTSYPAMLVSILVGILILGSANHCIFEDLFLSATQSTRTTESSPPAKHTHNDPTESHEHGQSHVLLIVNQSKTVVDSQKMILPFLSLVCIVILSRILSSDLNRKKFFLLAIDQPAALYRYLHALIVAAQAPPYQYAS